MLSAAPSFAQKQTGGEKNLQVLLAPLGGSPITINGISFRKFNSTGDGAFRLNLFLGFTHTTDILSQANDSGSNGTILGAGNPETQRKSSGMTISLRPGYEKHFGGTDRLSPYIGAEALFTITSLTVDSEYAVGNGDKNTAATAWQTLTTEATGKGTVLGNTVGTTIGLNLIAGADYFIAKDLHLGVEFGWGFATTSKPDAKSQRLDTDVNSAVIVKDNPTQVQGSSWTIAPNAIAQFKLGWLFGK